jgi:predicted lipoprotein with Yx(FWY)xxD motif
MNSRFIFGLTALALFGTASIGAAQDYGNAEIAMNAKEPFGKYLTDGEGRSLYVLEQDKPGLSTCYEACAKVWPPFMAEEESIKVKDVDKGLIDVIKRDDGQMQVIYDGKPLYYYIKDKGRPGSTKGHDVHDEFGEWYLVTPSGKMVKG